MVARGQTIQIPAPRGVPIRATNPEVIKLRDLGSKIALTGLKIGQSTLVMGSRVHHVYVYTVANALLVETLKQTLKPMMGLSLDVQDGKTRITGELLRWKDWEVLARDFRKSPGDYQLDVTMTGDLRTQAQDFFEDLVRENQLAPVRWNFNGRVRAYIGPTSEQTIKSYQELLSPWGIGVIKDSGTLTLAPMIEVEILVVELQKRAFSKFGVSWPESYSAQVLPSLGGLSPLGSFSLALNALEEKGEAQILASPKLLCRSGKSAEFLAGGEFPIKVRGRKDQNDENSGVIWKKHGVLLKVKPLADLAGRMSIEIETEVSSINLGQAVESLPSLNTNRIQSHFDLEKPVTLALSGLLKNQKQSLRKGLPILSQIPILGALFSSRDYVEDRSELVFFVTPRVIGTNVKTTEMKYPNGWKND